MKKIRVILIALLLPMAASAQLGIMDVKLGLKGGVNLGRMDGTTFDGSYKTGLHGGAFFGVSTKKIGGQIEAIFSQATYTASGEDLLEASKNSGKVFLKNAADSARNGNVGVSYLSIPILFNLKFFNTATIQLGPQYSSVISVNDKDNLLNDPDNFFNSSDVSGVVGIWFNLPLNINAGARYIFGLSDMNLSSVGDSWKTRTIQLHVGYSFL